MGKRIKPVLYISAHLALLMAGMMLVPALYAAAADDIEFLPFLISSTITAVAAVVMMFSCRTEHIQLAAPQLYMLTCSSWVLLSFAGALPLTLIHHPLGLSDAFFEAVSGITTTGSTVMSHLADVPRPVLLWRSILQWIGGLGVIGMAVSILPFLRVGGMRLFQTESSDWSDKSLPRFQKLARSLLIIYLFLTLACVLAYRFVGMSTFDAINHGLTTVSTGGYATDDASMGRYDDAVLWVSTFFMLAGGLPFTVFIRFTVKPGLESFRDEQVKGYLAIFAAMVAVLWAHLVVSGLYETNEALTQAAFNIASVMTTTGYASADYTGWSQFSVALFFCATFIGGCSGSTSGGMKIFRFQLSFLFVRDQLRKLIHPRAVFSIRYNGRVVQDDIVASSVAFSFMFFVSLAVVTLLLAAMGIDFMTSFTGAATALTNVGPGLGDIIGPAGNFAPLPVAAKWVLALAMILGRLELLTVMVLLSPSFWRD